jgi:uncharacterized protein YecE (DUF72 family)
MDVWIGTSGYSFPNWVGGFYPPGTRGHALLHFYARHFPVVELNFTFYRCPTPQMLARLARQTPAAFRFAVKVPRSISHEGRWEDMTQFRAAIDVLAAANRLAEAVCQLPQSVHNDAAHRHFLERMGLRLAGLPVGVEFRHVSWTKPNVVDWLRKHHLDLIAVDVPDLPALYPRGPVWSGTRFFARLHSRNAANWYAGGSNRYDFDYPDDLLQEWVAGLRLASATCDVAYLMFNNCKTTQAVGNAKRMGELLRAEAPDLRVVPPFPPDPPSQPTLFD